MNFPNAIASGLRGYVTFSGRSSRSEYWYWSLAVFIINLILVSVTIPYTLSAVHAMMGGSPPPQMPTMVLVFHYLINIFSLAVFLPGLALVVRRLHDRDKSGWWFLIALTGLGCLFLLVWFCQQGTDGPNRFGDDPLGFDGRDRLAEAL